MVFDDSHNVRAAQRRKKEGKNATTKHCVQTDNRSSAIGLQAPHNGARCVLPDHTRFGMRCLTNDLLQETIKSLFVQVG
jgi:hypothetical protein